MGFYTRFTDPAAREVIVQYYGFMKKYDSLFKGSRSHAEAVLLFPRRAVHQGNLEPLARFRELGRELLNAHVLFDVLPDDEDPKQLAKDQHVYQTGDDATKPASPQLGFSRIDAPQTVRVSASRSADNDDEIAIHLVNYNREEPPRDGEGKPSAGKGLVDEKPISVEGVRVEFVLPASSHVDRVEFATPENPTPQKLESLTSEGRVKFAVPRFDVYSVVRIRLVLER